MRYTRRILPRCARCLRDVNHPLRCGLVRSSSVLSSTLHVLSLALHQACEWVQEVARHDPTLKPQVKAFTAASEYGQNTDNGLYGPAARAPRLAASARRP